jgi:hypothetical protein
MNEKAKTPLPSRENIFSLVETLADEQAKAGSGGTWSTARRTILPTPYHPDRRLPHSADRVPYRDLGPDYFERLNADRLTRYHVRKLGSLGYHVNLRPRDDAA